MSENQRFKLLELLIKLRESEGGLFYGDIIEAYEKLSKLIKE